MTMAQPPAEYEAETDSHVASRIVMRRIDSSACSRRDLSLLCEQAAASFGASGSMLAPRLALDSPCWLQSALWVGIGTVQVHRIHSFCVDSVIENAHVRCARRVPVQVAAAVCAFVYTTYVNPRAPCLSFSTVTLALVRAHVGALQWHGIPQTESATLVVWCSQVGHFYIGDSLTHAYASRSIYTNQIESSHQQANNSWRLDKSQTALTRRCSSNTSRNFKVCSRGQKPSCSSCAGCTFDCGGQSGRRDSGAVAPQ